MSRYTEAPQEALEIMEKLFEDNTFADLAGCNIKTLSDTKKNKSKGDYVIANIKKTNAKEKYLSSDDFYPEGYDFLLFIDGNVFENISYEDKFRVMRETLRKIEFDPEAKEPYKLRDFDLHLFSEDLKIEGDEIYYYKERLQQIAQSVYEE